MNLADIARLRLAAQHMTRETLLDTPGEVARHMVAMQAQDYQGGLWSLGLRTKHATRDDVERAIRGRTIIRTWPMRGTLHVVHADDVWWLLDLLAPRATAAAASRRVKQLGLTDEIVAEAEAVLRHELHGGKAIARNNVAELLATNVRGIAIDNQHTQHLMRNFGERGVICFGPHEGKQPTFVLLDEWVPRQARKSRGEALAELARRYFTSHGPATLKDFAGWGMMTMSDARAGLEAAKKDLREAIVEGETYYYALCLEPAKSSETLLLPGFDEYLLGYKNRDAVLVKEHAAKVVPGNNGMFLSTVVDDGQVVGLWKRKINKRGVEVTYDYFVNAVDSTSAAEQRYWAFVNGDDTASAA